jgi:chromosome segregation ATPase
MLRNVEILNAASRRNRISIMENKPNRTETAGLQTELAQAAERLQELTDQREKVAAVLEENRPRFIRREIALEALQQDQARLIALDASIDDLTGTIAALKESINAVKAAADRKLLLDAAIEKGRAAFDSYTAWRERRDELDRTLHEAGQEMFTLALETRRFQGEYAAAMASLEPALRSGPGRYPTEQEPIRSRLRDELTAAGMPLEAYELAGRQTLPMPSTEFGDVFARLEQHFLRQNRPPIAAVA